MKTSVVPTSMGAAITTRLPYAVYDDLIGPDGGLLLWLVHEDFCGADEHGCCYHNTTSVMIIKFTVFFCIFTALLDAAEARAEPLTQEAFDQQLLDAVRKRSVSIISEMLTDVKIRSCLNAKDVLEVAIDNYLLEQVPGLSDLINRISEQDLLTLLPKLDKNEPATIALWSKENLSKVEVMHEWISLRYTSFDTSCSFMTCMKAIDGTAEADLKDEEKWMQLGFPELEQNILLARAKDCSWPYLSSLESIVTNVDAISKELLKNFGNAENKEKFYRELDDPKSLLLARKIAKDYPTFLAAVELEKIGELPDLTFKVFLYALDYDKSDLLDELLTIAKYNLLAHRISLVGKAFLSANAESCLPVVLNHLNLDYRELTEALTSAISKLTLFPSAQSQLRKYLHFVSKASSDPSAYNPFSSTDEDFGPIEAALNLVAWKMTNSYSRLNAAGSFNKILHDYEKTVLHEPKNLCKRMQRAVEEEDRVAILKFSKDGRVSRTCQSFFKQFYQQLSSTAEIDPVEIHKLYNNTCDTMEDKMESAFTGWLTELRKAITDVKVPSGIAPALLDLLTGLRKAINAGKVDALRNRVRMRSMFLQLPKAKQDELVGFFRELFKKEESSMACDSKVKEQPANLPKTLVRTLLPILQIITDDEAREEIFRLVEGDEEATLLLYSSQYVSDEELQRFDWIRERHVSKPTIPKIVDLLGLGDKKSLIEYLKLTDLQEKILEERARAPSILLGLPNDPNFYQRILEQSKQSNRLAPKFLFQNSGHAASRMPVQADAFFQSVREDEIIGFLLTADEPDLMYCAKFLVNNMAEYQERSNQIDHVKLIASKSKDIFAFVADLAIRKDNLGLLEAVCSMPTDSEYDPHTLRFIEAVMLSDKADKVLPIVLKHFSIPPGTLRNSYARVRGRVKFDLEPAVEEACEAYRAVEAAKKAAYIRTIGLGFSGCFLLLIAYFWLQKLAMI